MKQSHFAFNAEYVHFIACKQFFINQELKTFE